MRMCKYLRTAAAPRPSWLLLLILLASVSLTARLTTRFTPIAVPHSTTVRATSARTMWQYLNRAGSLWSAPVAQFSLLPSPLLQQPAAPVEPALPNLLLETIHYNRPPPSC
jgi:hypothetical protein